MTDSPQLENGYIRIANELFDAILSAKLKYSTQTVLLAVLRKTYGFNKKEDDISASQIGDICGISRQHVTTALNELAKMKIINKRPGNYGAIISINKNHKQWILDSPNAGQVSKSRTSPNLGQVSKKQDFASPNLGHTKDNHTKDNNTPLPPKGECGPTKKKNKFEYTEDFLIAWQAYPKRNGGNAKRAAFLAWRARIRSGVKPEELIAGVKRYAASIRSQNKENTQFVKQAKTFFGPGGHWEPEEEKEVQTTGWWTAAGFKTKFEAENAGFNEFNVNQATAEAL